MINVGSKYASEMSQRPGPYHPSPPCPYTSTCPRHHSERLSTTGVSWFRVRASTDIQSALLPIAAPFHIVRLHT